MSWTGIGLVAFGGFVLLEGLMWAVFPRQMREAYARMMSDVRDRDLHVVGLFSVFVGVVMLGAGIKLLG